MYRALPIARKEFLHIIRDPWTLGVAIFMPMCMLLLFGYAVTLDVRNVPIMIDDEDRTPISREFAGSFMNSGYFVPVGKIHNMDGQALIDHGLAKIVVKIPEGFSNNISSLKRTPIQILVDGADANTANIVMGYVQMITETYSAKIFMQTFAGGGGRGDALRLPVNIEPRLWYNPELKSAIFIVPGLIGIIMMMNTVILSAVSIVKEHERGTIEGIMVSPVTRFELMIGKLIPYFIIAFLDLFSVVILGVIVFEVPFRGNLLLLLSLSTLFVLGCLGQGLLISTSTKTQRLAWVAGMLTTMLPSMMLSGFVFPIASMPKVIQYVTYTIPARYFLSMFRGIILKGVGLGIVMEEAVALAIFAAVTITISAIRFQKTVD